MTSSRETIRQGLTWAAWRAANARSWRESPPDYVSFLLPSGAAALPPRRPAWQRFLPEPPTVRALMEALRDVAEDPRIAGVVLHLRPPEMPMADLESLRAAMAELRRAGKRVVAWATQLDTASYYLACAADEVLLQPGGAIQRLGLRRGFAFLADGLEHAGLRFDVVRVSPYKTAPDLLAQRELSPEAREMATWLLDDDFGRLIEAIAEGRGLTEAEARAAVDAAPMTDEAAREAGLVDGILSEEALPLHLALRGEPARIDRWKTARKAVVRRGPAPSGRRVALLRIEGMIVDGESAHPPAPAPLPMPLVGGERAGDLSVVQEVRRAAEDDDVAAAVLWIDSPGGSATASEAMTAALEELAGRKPLVAVMGAIAGSGGYYVATPAHEILARPGTLTGSIGVVAGKLVTAGLLDRLRVQREVLHRGAGMDMWDTERPFDEDQREAVEALIGRTYQLFVERVAASRGMSPEAVDAVGGGRVWTGRQGLERGLVDGLGGLEEGVARARELAGLSPRAELREVSPPRKPIGALRPELAPAAWLRHASEGIALLRHAPVLCLLPLLPEHLLDGR